MKNMMILQDDDAHRCLALGVQTRRSESPTSCMQHSTAGVQKRTSALLTMSSNMQSQETRTPSPVRDQSKKMSLSMIESFVKELVVD
jgi:hypothetical protein